MAAKSKVVKKVASKKAKGTVKRTAQSTATRKAQPGLAKASAKTGANGGLKGKSIRVRMYRIGFGDFFLLTVPSANGLQHILIDCGVHATDIGSMGACVQDLVQETGRKLALVIVTHYHADHLSGFATNVEEFSKFTVGAVWITNRLDPSDTDAMKFKAQLNSVATQLRVQFAARSDEDGEQALAKAENAIGVFGVRGGGGSNEKALALVTGGFANKPPVYYYEAGQVPTLPKELEGALTAEILGPAPKSAKGQYTATDNKKEQYLAAVAEAGLLNAPHLLPFDKPWPASADDYPPIAFGSWKTAKVFERSIKAVQPDALAATADALDGTLNNQSLVVLFTCQGKKLLFAGDAQWANWSYWLYGKPVTGADPGISERAKQILGSIDFYKVGHHGSTNATPIPAVEAMNTKCFAMCSTETNFPNKKRTYGNIDKGTEVPRTALMEALEKRLGNNLVRSDWIAAGSRQQSPEAKAELPKLPGQFTAGSIFIDCVIG